MGTQSLHELIVHDELLHCPGVHDPLTGAIAEDVGFDAIYLTGYGTSISKVGHPDAGLMTMPEMVENARRVSDRVSTPVVSDADNGYGNVVNMIRTVKEYLTTDVAAIHIEDQTFPKRCGHTEGRQLIPKKEAIGKFRAARDVVDNSSGDLVLIARTDALGATGGSIEEAVDRANAYIEAGADVAFVEGLTSVAEIEKVGEEVNAPLLYNWVGEIGTSPRVDSKTLEDAGFNMVIYPIVSTLATIESVYRRLQGFKEQGQTEFEDLDEAYDESGIDDFHEFSGFNKVVEWEKRYMPDEEQEKYADSLGDPITE